jgi:hypothetical protein
VAPGVPSGVCDAIAIALRYDREERFAAAAVFHDALHEGAAGFFISAPPIVPDAPPLNEDDIPTVPLRVAPAPVPEQRRPAVIVRTIIASAFVAVATAIILTKPRPQTIPPTAPTQKPLVAAPKSVIDTVIPSVVNLGTVAPVVKTVEVAPPKKAPFAAPATRTEPSEDLEAKGRRELDSLRASVRLGLTLAEQELGILRFDAAIADLDRVAEMAQRDPVEFRDERDQIAQLRTRVVEKRVAVEAAKAEAAQWASRLAGVEEDLRAEHWPEAERFAGGIANDARAPEAVAARAKTLLERAKEGRKNAFKDTQVGPTNNTIRKPSSPPGK